MRGSWVGIVIAVMSLGVSLPAMAEERAAEPLELNFLDAGQAHALHIQKGDLDIFVDVGRHFSGAIQETVEGIEGRLELMIITHPHADHFGGGAGILEATDVGMVVSNGERRGPPRDNSTLVTWERFEEAVDGAGLRIEAWEKGQRFRVTEHLTIEVLASGGDFPDTSSGTHINDDSLVLMVEYQGRRILLPGDLEEAGGQWMVEEHCGGQAQGCSKLDSDIFLVPHHGSHHFDEGFFEAANPTWAVFGAPYDNRQHHHPRLEPLRFLVDLGARIKATNKGGGKNVEARIQPGGDVMWNIEDSEIFVWRSDGEPEATYCEVEHGDGEVSKDCDVYGD